MVDPVKIVSDAERAAHEAVQSANDAVQAKGPEAVSFIKKWGWVGLVVLVTAVVVAWGLK